MPFGSGPTKKVHTTKTLLTLLTVCYTYRFQARNDVAWLPNLTFGVVSIIAGLVVLLLPETTNKALPDTLDDVLNLYPRKRRVSIRRESYKPPEEELELRLEAFPRAYL